MATARKKTSGGKTTKPAVKAKSAPAKAKSKPVGKTPAPKPTRSARPAAPTKSVKKPVAKVAPKAAAKSAKPAAKAPAKVAAKAPAKVVAKAQAKAPTKPAAKAPAKVVAKPVAKGAAKPAAKPAAPVKATAKPVAPVPVAKPVPKGPPRLVPVTPDARARALALKNAGTKPKHGSRPAPEVRPLGVLPPESMARTRSHAHPVRPVVTRPAAPVAKAAPKRNDEPLTEADIAFFEKRLLEERDRVMKQMGYLDDTLLKVNPKDSAGDLSSYSFHMADAGTDSMQRENAFNIASKEGRLLVEINDALLRLYNGQYGICEASGKPISRARLKALPWARFTLEEQERIDREMVSGRHQADE